MDRGVHVGTVVGLQAQQGSSRQDLGDSNKVSRYRILKTASRYRPWRAASGCRKLKTASR